jgi:hypothetical protein
MKAKDEAKKKETRVVEEVKGNEIRDKVDEEDGELADRW